MSHVYNWGLFMCMAVRGSTCGKRSRSKKTGECKDEGEAHLDDSHCSPLTCAVFEGQRERERERSCHAFMQAAGYELGCRLHGIVCWVLRRSSLAIMMLGEKGMRRASRGRYITATSSCLLHLHTLPVSLLSAAEMSIRRDRSAHGGVSHREKEARRGHLPPASQHNGRQPCKCSTHPVSFSERPCCL